MHWTPVESQQSMSTVAQFRIREEMVLGVSTVELDRRKIVSSKSEAVSPC